MQSERQSPMLRVRGVVVAQLEKSLLGLHNHDAGAAAIHDVRKELKRARASLRLMRKSLGKDAYHRANQTIRDAARPLSPLRDASVLLRTFQSLRRRSNVPKGDRFDVHVSRVLRHERNANRERLHRMGMAAAPLSEVKRRMARVPASRLVRVTIGAGVKRVYRSGRKAFERVRRKPTDERLHEWRKQVKYLCYQIDVLARMSSGDLSKLRRPSLRLADCLGEDHDLAVLLLKITRIANAAGAGAHSKPLRAWEERIGHRRAELQGKARRIGKKLYSKRPKRIEKAIDERLEFARLKSP